MPEHVCKIVLHKKFKRLRNERIPSGVGLILEANRMKASRTIVLRPSHSVAFGLIALAFVAGIVSIQNEWWSNWIVRLLVVLLFGVAFAIMALLTGRATSSF
jgi:hypothetical protein